MEAAALDTLQAAHRGDLDELKTRMHSHAPGELPPIYLKVAFPVHKRGVATEWMWVQVVHWGSETLEGVLVNEPILRTDVRAGQYVAFTRDRVADFQESSGSESRGNALRKMVQGGLYSPSLGGNIPASAAP